MTKTAIRTNRPMYHVECRRCGWEGTRRLHIHDGSCPKCAKALLYGKKVVEQKEAI